MTSNNLRRNTLTKAQALEKIKSFCSYQERCHSEVITKLYSFGLYKKEVDEIVANIIEDNYLNEERFAVQYAGGKFRMKHWGRKKILHEMQQKRLSPYCIKLGLKAIDEVEYKTVLEKLASVKWTSLPHDSHYTRVGKTYSYLLQKGYESELIKAVVEKLQDNKD